MNPHDTTHPNHDLTQSPSTHSVPPAYHPHEHVSTHTHTQPQPQHHGLHGRHQAGQVISNLSNKFNELETQYVHMLLALDKIPPIYSLLASFFTWILLAGFLLFPGTFRSLQNARDNTSNDVEKLVLTAISNVPLFVIAFLCTGIGVAGMFWLWRRWRNNYIWVTNKIFLPGFLNSIAGLISTIVNIFGVQHGELSTTSKITFIVTSVIAGVSGFLFILYNFWLLGEVKKEHIRGVGKERTGKHGEGLHTV